MIKYRIIQNTSSVELEAMIKEYLEGGWKVAGGVAVHHEPHYHSVFSQAMTLETETKENKRYLNMELIAVLEEQNRRNNEILEQ